jgi:hypothetical protein
MKKGITSEAVTIRQKAEEPVVKHNSKASSPSFEIVNMKLIPKTMKKLMDYTKFLKAAKEIGVFGHF